MKKKTNKEQLALGYCTSTLVAANALYAISEEVDKAMKTMANISLFMNMKKPEGKKDLLKAFKIKSANDCVKDAKDKPVTIQDINKAYDAKKAYAEDSFAAWHSGKKTQAAHSEGFDDGWQAALTVFGELCPDFYKWCVNVEGDLKLPQNN